MVYNHTSRLVTALLFNDIDTPLRDITGSDSIAYSPIYASIEESPSTSSIVCIDLPRLKIQIPLLIENFSSSELSMIHEYFFQSTRHLRCFLQIFFKRSVSSASYYKYAELTSFIPWMEIAIFPEGPENDKSIRLMLPVVFFRLFSKDIDSFLSPDSLVEKFLHYFKKPFWIMPDFRTLTDSLPHREFTKLFHYLLKKNRLTPYQIYLLTQGFPELSRAIKGSLSKNRIRDVLEFKKSVAKMKIGKRDILGGIYSVEESIFFIARDADDLDYSLFLKRLQRLITFASNLMVLAQKGFREWISGMIADTLLLPVLSVTDDHILGRAFSMDTDHSFVLACSNLTVRKQNNINFYISKEYTCSEVLSARAILLKKYRSMKIRKSGSGPERLEYLLACFSGPGDYQNLLLSVGWFHLSTAMKDSPANIVKKVVSPLPPGARILIEDVLAGTLNPNIIHDEGQVRKAKRVCVEAILNLYAEGTITLHD